MSSAGGSGALSTVLCAERGVAANMERRTVADLDDKALDEAMALADAATPGPWTIRDSVWEATTALERKTVDGPAGFDRSMNVTLFDSAADAAFIAAARQLVPALVEALRKARAERDRAEAQIAAVRELLNTKYCVTFGAFTWVKTDDLMRALDGDGATKGESNDGKGR